MYIQVSTDDTTEDIRDWKMKRELKRNIRKNDQLISLILSPLEHSPEQSPLPDSVTI